MIIRKAQADELSKIPLQTFEDEMVVHLAEFSPELFNVIKEEQLRIAVRIGIQKAEKYGFTFRGPIRLYLEMMLLFGSHFDSDPQYPWAKEILQKDTPQMERAEELFEKILDYQKNVSGENGANTKKALREMLAVSKNPPEISEATFDADARREMNRAFPQKFDYVGEEGIRGIIEESTAEAKNYQFPTLRGKALLIILKFAFGHGCTNDRLYPWIHRTLTDEKIVEPEVRSNRLEKKAVTWLEHVINNLDKRE
jgi:hypothetical protein